MLIYSDPALRDNNIRFNQRQTGKTYEHFSEMLQKIRGIGIEVGNSPKSIT